jgi:surface antigen
VHRTAGVSLRLTVGGGALVAFGLGALASPPPSPIAVTAAPTAVPFSAPIDTRHEALPHRATQVAVVLYVEATPTAAAVVPAKPAPPVAPSVSRSAASVSVSRSRVAAPRSSGAGNGFTYGYCTWWVANKRAIPWRGNAAQWWWNARVFGFAEGPGPQAGAIMVTGVSGTSPQGHVAYVESVNPGGSFVVSEMNWWGVPGGGWGRVDYRTVTSMRGVLGFIY